MPIVRVGTDADEVISVHPDELAGSTLDGAGGADTLVLADSSLVAVFDFTTATVFRNFETLRDENYGTSYIRLTSTQLSSISTFESTGTTWADVVEVVGSSTDFRNKTVSGPIEINLLDEAAAISVSSKEIALLVHGESSNQHLILEGVVLTDAERREIHDHGIDYVTDASGTTTEDLLPTLTGLSGDVVMAVKGQDVHLDVGADAVVSDEHPLESMTVSLDDWFSDFDSVGVDVSGRVTLGQPDQFDREDVFVDNVKIGTLRRVEAFDELQFSFNDAATGERVQVLIRALVFRSEGSDGFTDHNSVSVVITDSGSRTAESKIDIEYPNEPPSEITMLGGIIWEWAADRSWAGSLFANDPNYDDERRMSYSLIDDADGRFELDSHGTLRVKDGSRLDFKAASSYEIRVRATDPGGLSLEKTLLIHLADTPFDDVPAAMNRVSGFGLVTGTDRSDLLQSSVSDDVLIGGAGSDWITSGGGSDQLYGNGGNDILYGGAGRDSFVFNTKVTTKTYKKHMDRIGDFSVKDDSIYLENKVFKALGKKGSIAHPKALAKGFFHVGTKAHDADDHIIYNKKKGILYYDDDGIGGHKAVVIATLSKNLKMTYHDFFVI